MYELSADIEWVNCLHFASSSWRYSEVIEKFPLVRRAKILEQNPYQRTSMEEIACQNSAQERNTVLKQILDTETMSVWTAFS
jgi:hypothetical protein